MRNENESENSADPKKETPTDCGKGDVKSASHR